MRSDLDPNLGKAISGFKESLHANAERPDEFWAKQRESVRSRLNREVVRRASAWKWTIPCAAAVAACILIAGIFLNRDVVVVPDIAAGDDQDLLVAVEHALRSDVPGAIAPAVGTARRADIVVEVIARGR